MPASATTTAAATARMRSFATVVARGTGRFGARRGGGAHSALDFFRSAVGTSGDGVAANEKFKLGAAFAAFVFVNRHWSFSFQFFWFIKKARTFFERDAELFLTLSNVCNVNLTTLI